LRPRRGGDFAKGAAFRVSAYAPIFNQFQRDTLIMPTLVHTGDLDKDWDTVEAKALRALTTWLGAPEDIERYSRRLPANRRNFAGLQGKIVGCRLPWWRENAVTWGTVRHVIVPLVKLRVRTEQFFIHLSYAGKRIALALRGDTASIEKLRWRGRRFLAKLLGQRLT
jgi:hypothetical protein